MYNKLYTFGCSFTIYKWPTWADYLHVGGLAKDYSNWALPGGSNDFILHSFTECISRHKITDKDIVCIMWSQPARIADFTNDTGWDMPGNAYFYQPKERAKYLHEDKTALENHSYFKAVSTILQGIGCDFYFTSMERIDLKYDNVFDTKKLFNKSIAEFLGYKGANETTWRETLPNDRHPSPQEHANFAKQMFTLDTKAVDELQQEAQDHIFNSDRPWERSFVYYPNKSAVYRLPSKTNYYTNGNGQLIHVDTIKSKS